MQTRSKLFLCIATSVADVAGVNTNGIKVYLANALSLFLIKNNPFFSNCPKGLPKKPPDCPILSNWVSDNCL